MKVFKNHLKAIRFIRDNFTKLNGDRIISKLWDQSIVECSYNEGSEYSVIIVVDKYNLLKD
jgi:hypothetical protein